MDELNQGQRDCFREALEMIGLKDLGLKGSKFTWCNGRVGEAKLSERLDRVLGNEEWKSFLRKRQSTMGCLLF